MSRHSKLWCAATALAAASLVSACAGLIGEEAPIACPPARIAVPADRLGYNNEAGELTFVASMGELASSCRPAEDDIEVDIAFTMRAERGPGLEDGAVQLTYFLATVDPNREIVDKQLLGVELQFDPEQPVSAVRETMTLRLPAPTEASGANYSLYLGFQPDQQAGN